MKTSAARRREENPDQLTVWAYVPPIPTGDLKRDLIALALELAKRRDLLGVTIGEVVHEYETVNHCRVGGQPMDDKIKEQRQTSWLARVLPSAGLIATLDTRPSPLQRHHKKPQRVYQHPDIRGNKASHG